MNSMEIVTTRTGVTELRRRWRASDPWAALLIVHGLAEHSGRYQQAGARLAAAGVDTYAFDIQGFGASGGRRAYIDDWASYRYQVLDNLVPLFALRIPVVLLGHSIGGLMALDYTLSRHRRPDLVVLNAPALDAVIPVWKRIGAPLIAKVAPRLTLGNPIDPAQLFIDEEEAANFRNDPLVLTRTTVRLGDIVLEQMGRVGRSLDLYDVPTLVLHGGADTLVPPEVSEALGRLPTVERRIYPSMRHASINEPGGAQLVEDIVAWIRTRAGSAG